MTESTRPDAPQWRIYGCHVDLDPHMKPDGCVLDEGRPQDCVYAKKIIREGKGRDDCEYWKPIVLAPSETTTNQRAACREDGSADSSKPNGSQDSPAAAHQTPCMKPSKED